MNGKDFVPDMIIDGNIRMPFLQGVAVTLDLPRGRLWLSREDFERMRTKE